MIIIPEDVLRIAEALSAPIDELGLSVRSYNGLRRWGITTVADVYRAYQNKQLPRIRNLGEKSVIEIEKHLEEHLAKVAHVNTSETPNSSDTISRQSAIDGLRDYLAGKRCPDDGTLTCRLIENEVINKLPPIQPIQPKRGKWIKDGHHIRCDQCGMYMCDTDREGDRIPTEFCPHCGADMRVVTT